MQKTSQMVWINMAILIMKIFSKSRFGSYSFRISSHYKHAKVMLKRGVDVLIEKLVTLRLDIIGIGEDGV